MRVGRNDPCPCGSGKKYKKCCIDRIEPDVPPPPPRPAAAAPIAVCAPVVRPQLGERGRALADAIERAVRALPEAIRPVVIDKITGALDEAHDIERAAAALDDDAWLMQRIGATPDAARVVLALLAQRTWDRGDLLRALCLRVPSATGAAVREAAARWPIVWAPGPSPDRDRVSLLAPVRERLAPMLAPQLAVRWTPSANPQRPGLDRLRLALAALPGLVAQKSPKLTRTGTLHAREASRLAALVPPYELALAVLREADVVRAGEGILEIDPTRLRAVSQSELARAAIARMVSGPCENALLEIATAAPEGATIALGDALLAAALGGRVSIESATHHLHRGALDRDEVLFVRSSDNALTLSREAHALLGGRAGGEVASFVQPSFEVILSASAPFEHAKIVGLAAELVQLDAVARLRLCRDSVVAACVHGVSTDEILASLRAIAAPKPLPKTVETAVAEWAAGYAPARVATVELLEIDGAPALVDRAVRALADASPRRIAPNAIVLARRPTAGEIVELRALGVGVVRDASGPRDDDRQRPLVPRAAPAPALIETTFPRSAVAAAVSPERVAKEARASLPGAQLTAEIARAKPNERPAPRVRDTARVREDEDEDHPAFGVIAAAAAELDLRWHRRPDWQRALDRLVSSRELHRAMRVDAPATLSALIHAQSPDRLALSLAKIV